MEPRPGGFAKRWKRLQGGPPFLSGYLLPLSVRNTKFNKQKIGPGSLFSTLFFFFWRKTFKSRDPSEGLSRFWTKTRGNRMERRVVALHASPPRRSKQTPNRALPSENWSCEFEQKGNYVSWRKPEAELKAWRGFPSGAVCFLKFVTPCSETAPAEALGAVWKSSTTIWQRAAKLWAAY